MRLYHAGQWGGRGADRDLAKQVGHEIGRVQMLRSGVEMPNVLVSFVDVENDIDRMKFAWGMLRELGVERLFLDSGAFTAWTKGRDIPLSELYRAIDTLEPDVYVQLDVIGDAEGTRRNLERMRADGYRPMPVFTRGADFADLRRLLDEGERYICLGNIAKAEKPVRMSWCSQVFALVRDWMQETGEALPRFHAFGVSGQSVLEAFPFYSCDSSTGIMVTAYGDTLVFRNGQLKVQALRAAGGSRQHDVERHAHLVDAVYGDKRYLERRAESVDALNRMARHVTKVWAARGVAWDEVEVAA